MPICDLSQTWKRHRNVLYPAEERRQFLFIARTGNFVHGCSWGQCVELIIEVITFLGSKCDIIPIFVLESSHYAEIVRFGERLVVGQSIVECRIV